MLVGPLPGPCVRLLHPRGGGSAVRLPHAQPLLQEGAGQGWHSTLMCSQSIQESFHTSPSPGVSRGVSPGAHPLHPWLPLLLGPHQEGLCLVSLIYHTKPHHAIPYLPTYILAAPTPPGAPGITTRRAPRAGRAPTPAPTDSGAGETTSHNKNVKGSGLFKHQHT